MPCSGLPPQVPCHWLVPQRHRPLECLPNECHESGGRHHGHLLAEGQRDGTAPLLLAAALQTAEAESRNGRVRWCGLGHTCLKQGLECIATLTTPFPHVHWPRPCPQPLRAPGTLRARQSTCARTAAPAACSARGRPSSCAGTPAWAQRVGAECQDRELAYCKLKIPRHYVHVWLLCTITFRAPGWTGWCHW